MQTLAVDADAPIKRTDVYVYRSTAIVLRATHSFGLEHEDRTCTWDPPLVSLDLARLSAGSQWTNHSTCDIQRSDGVEHDRLVQTVEVKGFRDVTVGGTAYHGIDLHIQGTTTASGADDWSQSVSADDTVTDLGLMLSGTERTQTSVPNYSGSLLPRVRTLTLVAVP